MGATGVCRSGVSRGSLREVFRPTIAHLTVLGGNPAPPDRTSVDYKSDCMETLDDGAGLGLLRISGPFRPTLIRRSQASNSIKTAFFAQNT